MMKAVKTKGIQISRYLDYLTMVMYKKLKLYL